LQNNDPYHYYHHLDGLSGCGDSLELEISNTFQGILKYLVNRLENAFDKEEAIAILSGF
jgi:hypothetical protein